jgi:transcriptional regulator with GAF, ATPase, and Fis domain
LSGELPGDSGALLESELFGHVKGASPARKRPDRPVHGRQPGHHPADEIGDIPSSVQTKLLRVLQEGEVRPVGANESATVDVRILASTNQDLEAGSRTRAFGRTSTTG